MYKEQRKLRRRKERRRRKRAIVFGVHTRGWLFSLIKSAEKEVFL